MKLKKIISMFLCFAMLISFAPTVMAVGGPTVTVGSVAEAKAGDIFTIPVTISSNTGFTNYDFHVDYDSSVMTLKTVLKSGTLAANMNQFDGMAATGNIAAAGVSDEYAEEQGTTAIAEDGVLFKLKFEVNKGATSGNYKVSIAVKADGAFKNDKNDVVATFVPGTITVKADTSNRTVQFMNGDSVVKSETVANGGALTSIPGAPVAAEGQSFLGWYAVGGTNYVLSNVDDTITGTEASTDAVITADTTYHAIWASSAMIAAGYAADASGKTTIGVVAAISGLQNFVNSYTGGTVKLLKNVDLAKGYVVIQSGTTVTLDLNGKTLSANGVSDKTTNWEGYGPIVNNGNLALISSTALTDKGVVQMNETAAVSFDSYGALTNHGTVCMENVKLVSEAGVGTIAAGVAKAGAEVILISGFDGGTGAAPRNSIHNAGLPWELGIAEAHQCLIMNGLRSRVRIEADSKLMSGRDVAIAALLGAEEFGFGTGPLVAMGCVMMRVCNLDTCPMGICTQNPELRKRFKGKPEYIMNFMRFMAEDLREYMAKLGVRTVDELVGRTDLLKVKPAPAGSRAGEMDLTALLQNPLVENSNVHFNAKDAYNFQLEKTPDMRILMKKFKKSFDSAEPKPSTVTLDVGNTDRAFGTIIGSEITARFGNTLPDDTFHVVCHGYGGQSFGAFIPKGLTLELVGDANDYIGKGLSGGKLVVYPPKDAAFDRSENIVIGNVALYGATGGTAFINGVAGERFCVRNSGATAVVEGVGDHGCEYMTGGTVVVLGKTGKNFAAGMSGGIAYVLDEDWDFYQRVNKDMVSLEPVEHKYDVSLLKDLIREHVELTGSPRGKEILDNFGEYLPKFKKVLPHDYDKMLRLIAQMEEKGEDSEQAQIEAFYAMKSTK